MGIAKLRSGADVQNELIFQAPYVQIFYNEPENWLYAKWQGERTCETLMQGAEELLLAVKATKSTKILNDSSDYANPWPEVTDWFATNFAPRLQDAGIQYLAWIYDDQNVTKRAADVILQKERSEILVMVFDTLKTAEIWLRSVR